MHSFTFSESELVYNQQGKLNVIKIHQTTPDVLNQKSVLGIKIMRYEKDVEKGIHVVF